MEAVGGSIISISLEALIKRMQSSDLLTYAREGTMLSELRKWRIDLTTLAAVVDNAEEKESTNRLVRCWFSDLKDLVYDMEDVIDELDIEAHLRRLNKTKSLPGLIVAGLRSKIERITAEIEDIMRQKHDLGLMELKKTSHQTKRPSPTSLVNEANIYGREEDRKALLELMEEAGRDDNVGIPVIAIVGLGGIGKTTLANLIFNDASQEFNLKSWVFVGQDFDIFKLTKTILQSEGHECKDLNSLQVKLKEKLSGKKFLVVLDDVWIEDRPLWISFTTPFSSGAKGSRILITTRNQSVSSKLCTLHNYNQSISSAKHTVYDYHLSTLSHDDCLSVFAFHALGSKDFTSHMHLQEIGKEIVKRCQGLPLAAKLVGCLLYGTPTCKSWERVLNSEIWHEKSGILPALRLSYHHLPSHLKKCFAYCAIFPKDYEFDKDELILLWMAEGFLHQLNEGDEYFDDLVLKSFFQQSSAQKSIYVMHDLINDLARSISGEECFNLDEEVKVNKSSSKVRHSAFNRCEFDIAQRFEAFYEMKNLRTFLALPLSKRIIYWRREYLSGKVLDDLIPQFKCVRVLCLSGYENVELPNSISTLKHLRYLDVSHTKIKQLPESMGKLICMQTLLLRECVCLLELPTSLCDLINLQCLDISGTTSLKEMPMNISNLRNLHSLTKFIIGSGEGYGITELMEVSKLQGKLHISGLHNVKNFHEVDRIKLKESKKLEKLEFEWIDNFHVLGNGNKELQMLNLLQPPLNLTSLLIKSYGGTMFPPWIGGALFDKMIYLELCNCLKITTLPSLGELPSLRDLRIKGINGVKEVGMEFYGEGLPCSNAFPSLETLTIKDMLGWEKWLWPLESVNGDIASMFCKLRELVIADCPKLIGNLPNHLPLLQHLGIYRCPLLGGLPKIIPCLEKMIVQNCKEVMFKSMPIDLVSLTELRLWNIVGLECLNEAFIESMAVLEKMWIEECNELKYLCGDGIDFGKLASLKELQILCCKELVSLVEGEEGNFPCNLQVLEVVRCKKLVNFRINGLPYSMKSVSIFGCGSLTCLPKGILMGDDNNKEEEMQTFSIYIEQLRIAHNGSLAVAYSNVGNKLLFPSFVKSLYLGQNTMIPILFESLKVQHGLSHLTHLIITICEELESFPTFPGDMGLPIPTLTYFALDRCTKLRSLPNHMDKLTALRELQLLECKYLVSFPEGGFPASLSRLNIDSCDMLERLPLSEWRLHTLTNLQNLKIKGGMECCMEQVSSFPDDDDDNSGLQLLPSTLITIKISNFKNLKSISNSIRSLSSLQHLDIRECCQLQSLPRDGFPPSLGYLRIVASPLLKEKCFKGKEEYWPLIALIPCIWGIGFE